MKLFKITLVLAVIALTAARPQQSLDPSYLQYYSQIGQQQAAQHLQKSADSTPIYEHGQQEAEQQYVPQGQQIRLKDSTAEQARQQAPAAYISPNLRQYQQPQQHQPQAIQYSQPQAQQQQTIYKPAAPKQTLVVRRPQYQAPAPAGPQRYNKEDAEEEEYNHEPQSYQFGFDVKDDEFTNYQNRKEVKDGDVIKGSYSVVDSDGFIRTVTYTADPKEGFKAQVVREPTDIVVKYPTPTPPTEHRFQPQSSGGQQSQYSQGQYRPAPKQQQQPQQYQYQ